MLLEIAQVIRHHTDIRPPFFQTDQHTHADGMYARLPHAVETVDTPFELDFMPRG